MPLKNNILELLERDRGSVHSGAALAEHFGVSRNAVWKAVNALKAEGHDIVTDGKRGYMLTKQSDRLSAEGISAFLPGDLGGVQLRVFDKVGSTNDEAARFLLEGGSGRAVFISEQQTAGQTRGASEFYSPYGTGLYLSAIIRHDCTIDRSYAFTRSLPLAVSRAVEEVTGVKTQIKEPGDLYIGERKVCGIMAEAKLDLMNNAVTDIIVGVGINVTTKDFPEELRGKAASLGTATVRCRLAAEIIRRLYNMTDPLQGT